MKNTKLLKQTVGCLVALTMVMTNSYMGIGRINQKGTIAYAETLTYTVGDSTYSYVILEDDTVEITDYTGTETEILIPDSIEEKKVTVIGEGSFRRCYELISVEIPNTVTEIGYWAFMECYKLKNVKIPDSVKTINSDAFSKCCSLEKVRIPDSVEKLGDSAFEYCTSLIDVELSNSLTEIRPRMFLGCSNLESILIPDGVTSIGHGAFYKCSSLQNIVLPDSLTKIEHSAFEYCIGLSNIVIPKHISSIGNSLFDGCINLESIEVDTDNKYYQSKDGVLFDSDFSELILYPIGKKSTQYIVPNSVSIIQSGSFYGSSLMCIKIPDTVTAIKSGAFQECGELENVTIPKNVTEIGDYVFSGCGKLEKIDVDADNQYYKSLDGVLFDFNMDKLIKYPEGKRSELYSIPKGVTTIESFAFSRCEQLFNVEISDDVTYIGYSTFSGCSVLNSVIIPDSINIINDGMFRGCTSIKNINIPNTVTKIGASAFEGCVGLENISIPNSVTIIEYSAFEDCTSLENIDIPEGVTKIASSLLSGCTSLKNIIISKNVTEIRADVFEGCTSLENISVEEGSEYYKSVDGVLYNFNMTELIKHPEGKKNESYIVPDTVEDIYGDAFNNISNLIEVKIPASVTTLNYQLFDGCMSLESIVVDEKNQNYASIDGVLYRKNNGKLDVVIKYPSGKKGYYVMPDTVSYINDGQSKEGSKESAFYKCEGLVGIEISKSIKRISEFDFVECNNLKVVKIPDAVERIEPGTFSGCNSVSIYGRLGSYAETYAKENNVPFFDIDAVILGDANGDGNMDIKDSAIIKRYLAGWDVEINMTAADMDGDGKVTIKDSALIKRQLAGWE